jgi:hypothetical protein
MTVIPFARASGIQRGWQQSELQQLAGLYAAQAAAGEAGGWDVDATEAADPQFYLLAPGPEQDCLLCVSRVGRIYVLEDGNGGLLAENQQLGPVVDTAARILARRRPASFVMRVVLMLSAVRMIVEERLEPLLDESSDLLVRVAPQLATFV